MSEDERYAPPGAPVSDEPAGTEELAGRGQRLAGSIIDGICSGLLVLPFLMSSGYLERAQADDIGVSETLTITLMGMIVYLLLNGYLLQKSGQTIGKRVVGTRIVSVYDGQIVSLGKVFGLRFAPITLLGLLPVVGMPLQLVNVLFIFREDRRCVHDLLAGTRVVKVR